MRWLPIAVWIVSCGGMPAAPDAGEDDAGPLLPIEIAEPAPPEPPAPPAFTCPTGWRERDVGGARACEPWAEDAAPSCAANELAIPGSGCEIIDTCPADGWPADLPPDGVVYVRAGATAGDGTRAQPYGTLEEGLIAADDQEVIVALATGEYVGGSTLSMTNAELRGACASGTVVTNPETSAGSAAMTVYVAGAEIRNVSFRGGGQVLWLAPGASVTAREISIEATLTTALRLDNGAVFNGERVKLVGRTTAESKGYPTVSLLPSTTLSLAHSTLIEGSTAITQYFLPGDPSESGIRVSLSDTAIFGATSGIGGQLDATLERVALEGLKVGVDLFAGGTATVSDLRARNIGGGGQVAVIAAVGARASATATRLWISDGDTHGLYAEAGGSIVAEDVVAFDYRGNALFDAFDGGAIDVQRAAVRRVIGVVADSVVDATITLSDIDIDTVLRTDETDGDAMRARLGGVLTVSRAIARHVDRAFAIAASSGQIEAADTDIEDSLGGMIAECLSDVPDASCEGGPRSHIAIARTRMRSMRSFGIALASGSLAIEDADIDGVAGEGEVAIGMYLGGGAATVARVRVRRATAYGIAVFDVGSSLTGSDLRVEDTASAPCFGGTCDLQFGGDALACGGGGTITLERFATEGSFRAGLGIGVECGQTELSHGEITSNGIGVLTDPSITEVPSWVDVRVHDNGTDHNTSDLELMEIHLLD